MLKWQNNNDSQTDMKCVNFLFTSFYCSIELPRFRLKIYILLYLLLQYNSVIRERWKCKHNGTDEIRATSTYVVQ